VEKHLLSAYRFPIQRLVYATFRSGRFGLADSGWPLRSEPFRSEPFRSETFLSGPFRSRDILHFGLAVSVWGNFGHEISVHKQLITFVY